MTRAYAIDTVRSIKKTISRFISIVVIVALGSGLFVGLNSVSTDMTESADDYYKTKTHSSVVYKIVKSIILVCIFLLMVVIFSDINGNSINDIIKLIILWIYDCSHL